MKRHFGKRFLRYTFLPATVLILSLLLGGCAMKEAVGEVKFQDLVAPFERTSNVNRYDAYDENGNVSGYWVDEYTLEGKHVSRKLFSEDDQLLQEERITYPDKNTIRTEVYDGNGVLTEIRVKLFDHVINPNPNLPQELRVYNADNEMIEFEQYEYIDIGNVTWTVVSYRETIREDGIKEAWREIFNADKECPMVTWQALYENDVLVVEIFYDEDGNIVTFRNYNEDGTFVDETP